ncbi:MAG: hypothetical protein M1839_007954 [Geoglossum umbratile]|nr:MAG: hypothetical protein M1839_007954 [Geoglossum umbratile]
MDSPPLPNPYQQHPHPLHIPPVPALCRDFTPSGGEAPPRQPARETRYSRNNSVPSSDRSRDQIREDLRRARAEKRTWGRRYRETSLRRGWGGEDAMSGIPQDTGQSETWMEFLRAGPNHGASSGSHSRSLSAERSKAHSARRELARDLARRRAAVAASDLGQVSSVILTEDCPSLVNPRDSEVYGAPKPSRRVLFQSDETWLLLYREKPQAAAVAATNKEAAVERLCFQDGSPTTKSPSAPFVMWYFRSGTGSTIAGKLNGLHLYMSRFYTLGSLTPTFYDCLMSISRPITPSKA